MSRDGATLGAPTERAWRSLAKAVSWRITGSLDTTLLAFLFTGDLKLAAAIGSTEVLTKIGLYYLHERAWNRTAFGMSEGGRRNGAPAEKSWRSLAKAISWRVTGTVDTILLAYLFTGDIGAAAAIGMTEVLTKIVLYYVHERAWTRIGFGRVHRPVAHAPTWTGAAGTPAAEPAGT